MGLLLAGGAAWLQSLGSAPVSIALPPPPSQGEVDATIAALKPSKHSRPVVAIIGINHATETTDYLMPYGHATIREIPGSHAVYVANPTAVAALIKEVLAGKRG